MEKSKAEKWKRSGGVGMVYVLRRVSKENFTNKLSSWQRLKVGNGVGHLSIWGENVPGRTKIKCQGPEADIDLASLSKRRQPLWLE